MNQRQILFLFILFFPLIICSQELDSVSVYRINNDARLLEREGDFKKAYAIIDNLANRFDNNVSSSLLSYTLQTKSGIEKNLGQYEKSIATAKRAMKICIQLKDTINLAYNYNLIGIGFYFLSNYDSTKIYYEKSFELKKKMKVEGLAMAASAYNLGIVYEDLAQPERALELYLEAEKNLVQSGIENTFLSDVYIGIAHVYFYRMDIDKASEYAEEAMEIGLKSYGEFNPNMTFVYTSYANILENKGKFKESIKLLKKALQIRERTYGLNHEWTCESYYDLGNAFLLDKQFDQAENHYKKAIDIGEHNQSLKNLFSAKSYLANFYVDQNKNLEDAESLLKSILKYNISIYGKKNELISENYYYLAKIAKIKRLENEFWNYLSLAREAAGYSTKELSKTVAPFQALDALILESEWYETEYEISGELEFLENKYKHIDAETSLINFIQKNFSSDRSRINFANEYRKIFEDGLNTCWALYHKTNKNEKYLNKAFELSETNRNTTLLEGIKDNQLKKNANIPEKLLNIELNIRQKLAQTKLDLYYEQNSSNPDRDFLGELLNQRIIFSNRLDSLENSMDLKYPEYKKLKHQNRLIKPADVQNVLDDDTQLLTYFLGEENLFTFNINKDEITFLKGAVVDLVTNEIEELKMKLLSQANIKSERSNLYLYLIGQQIDATKSKMIVVPDNVLNYIPFEILLNENNVSLMDNFTISYSGSVHLYLELNSEYFVYDTPKYWLGFSSKNDEESLLSSALDEVEIVSDLVEGSSFVGSDSKKQNFFANNENYSILHFAMHAEIDNNNPLNNRLVFSDGELTASEIYVTDVKANMAVLSACNTGFGKLEKGEGVMSMARAFNYSGVPSVIMSLWKVPDKETKMIMVSFYKHLKKGKSKSEALCDAKKDYLSNVDDDYLKHPYFWSGFILNGNTDKLEPPQSKFQYLIVGFLIFGVMLMGLKMRKATA